jgi:DNA-binding response OmpR family regulator
LVLLIEDDFAIRRSLAEVLTDEGYEVTCAANGLEGLSILAEHRIRPGLIILDIWMPSMDGIQFRLAQKSLAHVANVPVLVITASRLLPRELTPLGLTHVMRKPLHLDELLTNVALLLS